MKKIVSAILTISCSVGLLTAQVNAEENRKYLYYEDFNHMEESEIPDGLNFAYGSPALIERTVIDEEKGDYAMKLTSGDDWYALGMNLGEVVVGDGNDANAVTSDKVTVEFDLKNEYGGFGFSWLTDEEVEGGNANILYKIIMNLGKEKKGNIYYPTPTTASSSAWYGPWELTHSNNGDIEGDAFESFGRWIHVKMSLDAQKLDEAHQYRFMDAEVEWTDNGVTYKAEHVGSNGRGMYIDGQGATGDTYIERMNGYRQKNIASVLIPVAAAKNGIAPTMEIDNLKVYISGEAATSPMVSGVSFNASAGKTPEILINMSEPMRNNILGNITVLCDGENVTITPKLSKDGKSCIISGALTKSGEYTVNVAPGGISYTGGIMKEAYSYSFDCIADDDGNINLLPMATGISAKIYDGSVKDEIEGISPYIDKISINFSAKMSDSIGEYVTVSNGLKWEGSLSEDKTQFIITPKNLEAGKAYTITVPKGTPAEWGGVTQENVTYTLKTLDEMGVIYTPIEILKQSSSEKIQSGEACKAFTEVYKTSDVKEKATLIVCQYQYVYGYERLKAVEFKHIDLDEEAVREKIELSFIPAGYVTRIKTYLLTYPDNRIIGKVISEVVE